jgi:hypothetical protein
MSICDAVVLIATGFRYRWLSVAFTQGCDDEFGMLQTPGSRSSPSHLLSQQRTSLYSGSTTFLDMIRDAVQKLTARASLPLSHEPQLSLQGRMRLSSDTNIDATETITLR